MSEKKLKGENRPMKRLLSTALALTCVLGSALAQTRGPRGAFPGRGHPGPGEGGVPVACLEALALTGAQQSSLAALQQSSAAAIAPLFEQRRSYRDRIDAALQTASPDPSAIGVLVIADHGVAVQMRSAHEQFLSGFQALLTAEQLASYTALRENGVCAEHPRPPR
jgi:Spy/CpxP family protein refolding chaperone